MALSERDKAILDFERSWWLEPGPKSKAIRRRFNLSGARYYEVLGGLVSSAEAAAYDPLVIRRLRRMRDRRRRVRHEGPAAGERPGR